MSQWSALALTLTIEGLVGAGLLYAWLGRRGAALARGIALVVAASCLTHPFAWHANRAWLVALPFPERASIIELAVVLAEAAVLHLASGEATGGRLGRWPCLAISAAANGASFGYGLLRLA